MLIQFLKKIRKILLPHWTDIYDEIFNLDNSKKILHLGPGLNKIKNTISIDINSSINPDIVWDLNKIPWPLKDNSIDTVVAMNVIEHLDDTVSIVREIHRVSKEDAIVNILVPHFSDAAAFVDPTHKSYFSSRTFDYFINFSEIEKDYGFYNEFRFDLVNRYIEISTFWRYIPFILFLVRKFPKIWEKYFCYIVRGDAIFLRLRVKK